MFSRKKLSEKETNQLNKLKKEVIRFTNSFLGYPVSKDFDYLELYSFLKYPINNLGDPFEACTYKVQSHEMEKEIVRFFAKMFRANPEDYWGYVTNGGSESNLYGLYLAREIHPNAIVYYSESTHYSVKKNIHLLKIPSIVIRSQENGEMDYKDFTRTVQLYRDKPAIVLATCGTTMTEGKDNIGRIKKILKDKVIHNHYIHCDAALSGSYAGLMTPKPSFDFADGADSISISGHKFIGSPIPCGVIVTKKSNRDRIAKGISYIGSLDTTITGSRNGHSVLFLWYALKQLGIEGLKARYKIGEGVASYAVNKFLENDIPAWKNEGSLTVVFPKVEEWIKEKWQLATEEDITHIICMPNVTKQQIDEVVKDILTTKQRVEKIKDY